MRADAGQVARWSASRDMTLRVVRLGSPREHAEGVRIGTVRRPPRGVPKAQFATQDWYDVWLPILAPDAATLKIGLAADTSAKWARFARRYKAEMKAPAARQTLELLAALSHTANFSVGCYCVDETRCHRSILRELLAEHGAKFA